MLFPNIFAYPHFFRCHSKDYSLNSFLIFNSNKEFNNEAHSKNDQVNEYNMWQKRQLKDFYFNGSRIDHDIRQ